MAIFFFLCLYPHRSSRSTKLPKSRINTTVKYHTEFVPLIILDGQMKKKQNKMEEYKICFNTRTVFGKLSSPDNFQCRINRSEMEIRFISRVFFCFDLPVDFVPSVKNRIPSLSPFVTKIGKKIKRYRKRGEKHTENSNLSLLFCFCHTVQSQMMRSFSFIIVH